METTPETGEAVERLPMSCGTCPNCGNPCEYRAAEAAQQGTEEPHPHYLNAKNVFAGLAATMFALSLILQESQFLWRAIAYGLGALAYLGELLVMTHGFKKRPPFQEVFMPYLFGGIYIILGLSYAIEHF